MSNEARVSRLIDSILEIEREYLKDRLNPEAIAKKHAVKAILEKIEEVIENEDQNN